MIRTVKFFLPAKTVIGLHKNSKNSLEILHLSRETPAAPRQRWDIMAQISIDTLYGKGVIFVVDIEDMLSWKDHIQIPAVSIRTIEFRIRSCIDHSLNCPGHFVPAHGMAQDLSRFSAHHRHNIDVLPGFCPRFILQKPVQLIHLYDFRLLWSCLFLLRANGLFLSNSLHWIYSSSGSFLRLVHSLRRSTF